MMNLQTNNLILGIDIGGTNIKSGLVSVDGKVTGLKSTPTKEWINSNNFAGCLIALVKTYINEGIVGCGITIPGTLTPDNQALFVPAIPCIEGLYLINILQNEFPDLYIAIENDSNAASFGEYQLHPGKMQNGMLLITLGTGVGCGLILNDEIFKGGNGNALELGEILSEKNERLEDLIGVNGIEKMANANNTQVRSTVPDIIRAANNNEPFAVDIMHAVGKTLGRSIAHMFWLFDVWNIVLGGGVSEAFTSIHEGLEMYFAEVFSENTRKNIRIEKAVSGNNAGLIGIALLCFERNRKK